MSLVLQSCGGGEVSQNTASTMEGIEKKTVSCRKNNLQ